MSNLNLGSNSVEAYDIKEQEWLTLSPLPGIPALGASGFLWNRGPAIINGGNERSLFKWENKRWTNVEKIDIPEDLSYPVILVPNVVWVCE